MKRLRSSLETALELVKPPAPIIPPTPRATFRIPQDAIDLMATCIGSACDAKLVARHRLLRDANHNLDMLRTIAPKEAEIITAKLEQSAVLATEAYTLVLAARDRHGIAQITG